MESIGTILRNERDKRGVSLAEVHEATKITVQNLSALEEDRFEDFPNKVYARAFLRDYANYLKLDSSELLERYEAEWGSGVTAGEAVSAGTRKPVAILVPAFVVVAAVAVGAYFAIPHRPHKAAPPAHEKVVKKAPAVQPKPKPTPVTASAPAPAPAPVTELKLQVTGVGMTWMRVQADDQPATEFTLTQGQVKSFTAKNKFVVRSGRPEGAKLHLNGQPLKPLGPASVPVTATIDRTWLKPAPAEGAAVSGATPALPGPATAAKPAAKPGTPPANAAKPAAANGGNPQ